jgi:DHA2 family multidrug resistance protein-like MFS transporter
VGAIGYLLVIIGFLSLALYRSGASFWVFVPGLLLVGAGAQTLNVPFGSLIMRSAPEGYVGPVTGARTTIGQFAYALGMAGATVLVDRLTEGGLVWRLREAGAPPVDTGQALDAVSVYMRTGQVPGAAGLRAVLADAAASYAHAFSITMLVVAVVLAMLGVALLVLLRRGAAGDLAQR